MSTPRQIEANRLNAQKSTGPRSPEGKAASRFNALKTGIHAQSLVIPGEDPEELQTLADGYHAQFPPATALERFLVDSLIQAEWQLRRLHCIEAQVWQHQLANSESPETPSLGSVFDAGRAVFTLLQRRIDAAERSYFRALKELQRLQAAPSAVEEEDELASFFPVPPARPLSASDAPAPPPFMHSPASSAPRIPEAARQP